MEYLIKHPHLHGMAGKFATIAFSILFLCSSSDENKFTFPLDYSVEQNQNARTRVFIFPGAPGDKSQWTNPPHTWLVNGLVAAGVEIVSVAVPFPQPQNFTDAAYKLAFMKYLDDVFNAVDAKYGRKNKTVVGGISFGGLHALMAAELRPQIFNEWFASFPVTKLSVLSVLWPLGDFEGFDPTINPQLLSGRRGLLLWGNKDLTVNYTFTKLLFDRLDRSNVTGIEYDGAPHETTDVQISAIVDWVKSGERPRPD